MLEKEISLEETASTLEKIKVLILADATSLKAIALTLDRSNLHLNWQQASKDDLNHAALSQWDLVLYDANFSQITLDKAICSLSVSDRQIPLLVVNGEPSIPTAIAAVKAGAADYIPTDALAQLPKAIAKARSKTDVLGKLSDCDAQSEGQLQKLITENADGIIVVDRRGIVKFVNPAALELLGKSSTELIGEALGFPVVNGDFLEVDIPINPDKILVAQMRVSQIQWQGAEAYVVSLRDITELKQAELERAKLLEEAQAANRAKDDFLAILSHELRTPLNPIVGWSQLLLRGKLTEEKIKKGAEIIYRNAMLQTKLIGDILDISRIIRGELELQAYPVNLADIISNALDTVGLAAQAKSIQIETNLDNHLGLVQGDSTRLQQVVWNLLSNAVKFTPHGGKVDVVLSLLENEFASYAKIHIKDSGKGISSAFLPHVFDYFCQAESSKSRSEGGMGLGLAIVRRLVELHGGTVTASSTGIGMGATFTVLLPILNNPDKSISTRSLENSNNLSGIKVLVVDDNDDSRNLIGFVLETEGAEVNLTKSATEALSVIEQFQPNILVSDIGMPQIDGYELITKIRQLPSDRGGKVKAIAISGYASEQDRQKSLDAGFNHHLNKPIEIEALMKVIS